MEKESGVKKILVLLFVISVLFSQQTIAADHGWYIGLGIGQSSVDLGIDVTVGSVSIDEEDTAFKVFSGYEINDYIAIEGFYLNAGEASISGDAGDVISGDGETLVFPFDNTSFKFELKSYGVVGVVGYPVCQYFYPYLKLGFQKWNMDITATMADVTVTDDKDGTGALYGAGFRIDATSNVSVRAEFEIYDFDGEDVDVITANIMYRF